MKDNINIKDLKDKFIEIQKSNWIKGSSNGRGNVGTDILHYLALLQMDLIYIRIKF